MQRQVMMNVDLTPGGVSAGERVVAGGALYPRIGAPQQDQHPLPSASEAQEPQQYSHPHAANGTGGAAEGHQQPPPHWVTDGPKRKAESFHSVSGPAGYAGADGSAYQHAQKQQRIS
jgi:hypothetical protein